MIGLLFYDFIADMVALHIAIINFFYKVIRKTVDGEGREEEDPPRSQMKMWPDPRDKL